MIKLRTFKKLIRMSVCYSASDKTLKRLSRENKVKHYPARYKLRLARQIRQGIKSATFASRYKAVSTPRSSRQVYDGFIQQAADFSNLELKILASYPDINNSYLLID